MRSCYGGDRILPFAQEIRISALTFHFTRHHLPGVLQ